MQEVEEETEGEEVVGEEEGETEAEACPSLGAGVAVEVEGVVAAEEALGVE